MIYKVATGKTQARDHMSVLGGTTGTHMVGILVSRLLNDRMSRFLVFSLLGVFFHIVCHRCASNQFVHKSLNIVLDGTTGVYIVGLLVAVAF